MEKQLTDFAKGLVASAVGIGVMYLVMPNVFWDLVGAVSG